METIYKADNERYRNGMKYRRCGESGLLLPEISLGLWHNFGSVDNFENCKKILHCAFRCRVAPKRHSDG